MSKKHCTAILLAGGRGSRMGGEVHKQFLELGGKPLIWYSLMAIERSKIIDDCVLVVGRDDMEYMRSKVLDRGDFRKVLAMAPGGSERYESVWNGLSLLGELQGGCEAGAGGSDFLFIHDGARPCVTEEILERCYEDVVQFGSSVAAVPSKDTVKITDEEGFVLSTPDRKNVWNVQTPQVFEAGLVTGAYAELMRRLEVGEQIFPTDDAGVVEMFTDSKVRLTLGAYTNLKVTTPEDMGTAEKYLENLSF
jgi:2-C-methyl-D-erythritol 4-phosphate cytidylyltransferase